MANEKLTGLDAEALKSILSTVIAEARKAPDPTPEQIASMEQEKAMRRQAAETIAAEAEQRRQAQASCPHMRPNGTTPAVFVRSEADQYMLCQHCQKIVRPDEPELFNRLFQLSRSTSTF